MVERGNIESASMAELTEIVSNFPWYAAAQMELCRRIARAGAGSSAQYADAALHVPDRTVISNIVRLSDCNDYSDKDIETLLKVYLEGVNAMPEEARKESDKQIFVVGGDYFSQAQYDTARHDDDGIYASFAANDSGKEFKLAETEDFDFCTETLAQIYAEQEYYDKAKEIYSKLSLLYPEKSVYFAAQIEQLDNKK